MKLLEVNFPFYLHIFICSPFDARLTNTQSGHFYCVAMIRVIRHCKMKTISTLYAKYNTLITYCGINGFTNTSHLCFNQYFSEKNTHFSDFSNNPSRFDNSHHFDVSRFSIINKITIKLALITYCFDYSQSFTFLSPLVL